jgi:PAS domain S-box-containing protein
MRSADSWAQKDSLRQLFDHLSDPLLLLDRQARITFANSAALRSLGCEAGTPLVELRALLGDDAVRWIEDRVVHFGARKPAERPPVAMLPDGRRAQLAWQALDDVHGALRLQIGPMPVVAAPPGVAPRVAATPDELLRLLWRLPFPATLQDDAYRIVDVNQAYLDFTGYTREKLIGIDPLQLQPEEDRAANQDARSTLVPGAVGADGLPFIERRLIDAGGRERWFRAARSESRDAHGQPLRLVLMQDSTAEHAARERADRSARELDDWFDLSPVGMVLFDEAGLLVRTNPAFDALVGDAPPLLADAASSLQQLLAWEGDAPAPRLQPGSAPVVAEAWVTQRDGTPRRLRSTVRCYRTPGGQRRHMAVVEDRSIEEERDLAHMQIGALIDTAGVGIATFRESSGWVRQQQTPASPDTVASAALQSIGRDIVVSETLPEYERLQQALRQQQRADVRYAVRHPELGLRWLQTRVEPATLASGQRTTSVVTLDVTEQHTQQQRSEQLLHEMSTILDSSPAGIAYLRANVLVRCNRRFETMLGVAGGALAGSSLQELFGPSAQGQRIAVEAQRALREGTTFETEFEVPLPPGNDPPWQWYALSVRRMGPAEGPIEAIAVLSDVTRLKMQQRELEVLADERHRAEQAVTLQAERTRAILDSVLVGIVTVGARGIEWMNRSARRMFGGDLADFVGHPIDLAATPEPEHPFRRTHYLDELVEGQAETFECKVKAKDGREFWVVGNAVATGHAGGRQLTYALLDIERRRQAEARIAEAQASLQRIIEAAPMSITLRDARTLRVLQVNEAAARTVGRTPAEIVGLAPEDLFDPATAAERRAHMEHALATGELVQVEYRTEASGGETRVWDARYLPLASPGQPPDQLLLVATDVTEQRAAQQAKLEAALAQREMLVKEVHHRIKNNLQGVAGLLQQIAQRKPEVAPVISEVVGQVQAIAQVYGLQVGVAGPLRLASVIEAITGSVQRTFGHPILLALEGAAPREWALPEAESIPIALTVNELLTNAVKHSIAGRAPQVACTLVCAGDHVRIVIRNRAQLPADFDLARFPGGVSGLGLVRSLLPRRSAKLTIEQQGEDVVATIVLSPPGVTRLEAM